MTKLQKIQEKASRICRNNQYLLDEIEVKQIIEEWHSDVKILSNIIDNLHKQILEKYSENFVLEFAEYYLNGLSNRERKSVKEELVKFKAIGSILLPKPRTNGER